MDAGIIGGERNPAQTAPPPRFGGTRLRIKALPLNTLSPAAPVAFIAVKDRTLTPLAEARC